MIQYSEFVSYFIKYETDADQQRRPSISGEGLTLYFVTQKHDEYFIITGVNRGMFKCSMRP